MKRFVEVILLGQEISTLFFPEGSNIFLKKINITVADVNSCDIFSASSLTPLFSLSLVVVSAPKLGVSKTEFKELQLRCTFILAYGAQCEICSIL